MHCSKNELKRSGFVVRLIQQLGKQRKVLLLVISINHVCFDVV